MTNPLFSMPVPASQLLSIQFVFFFENYAKPEENYYKLNETLGGLFDQTPIVLPIPYGDKDLALIPVVQMKSSKNYTLNIARSRADFFIFGEANSKLENYKAEMTDKVVKIFNFFQAQELKIFRIALLIRNFYQEERQADAIANLLSFKPLDILSGTSIFDVQARFTVRDQISSFKVNNYTLVEGATLENPSRKGIQITRDFNTVDTEKYSFEVKNVIEFIDEALKRINFLSVEQKVWL